MNNKLAAAQAREKALRDALETIQLSEGVDGCILSAGDCSRIAYEVLTNQPSDDTALNNLLAEGQAREKVLRNALGYIADWNRAFRQTPKEIADIALAQLDDDTALKAALANERERCIAAIRNRTKRFIISDFGSGTPVEDDCIEAIRALGDA